MDVLRSAQVAALLLVLALAPCASAAEAVEQASQQAVEAAYLYKFGDYVEWPALAFSDARSPFVIGVLGADDVAAELEGIVDGRLLGQRPVEVRRLTANDPLTGLHILYVGLEDIEQQAEVLRALAGQPTLTVTSTPEQTRPRSIITFIKINDRIRFDVALPPAEREGLKISSLLLAVARRVES